MKKIITMTMAAALVATAATASVDVTLDLASAYVFRGVTFNDGAVFQPGIEASGLGLPEEYGAVAVGAWGNYDIDDYGGALESSEFSEVDWYLSYSLPTFVDGLDLYVGYTEYTYPGSGDGADKEANAGVGYEIAGVGLGYTLYWNIGGGGLDAYTYHEFAAAYGLDFTEEFSGEVGARLGFLDDGVESGFSDYDIYGAVSYALGEVWSAGFSLAYIGQGDDVVLPDGEFGYDVDVVGMLSLAASL